MTRAETDITLAWVATGVMLVGGLLTSFAIDPINVYFLNFGSFLFLIWSIRIKDKALITVNGGMLLIYMIGILRVLIG